MQIFKWVPAKIDELKVQADDLKQNEGVLEETTTLNDVSIQQQSTQEISDVSQVQNGKSELLVKTSGSINGSSDTAQPNGSDGGEGSATKLMKDGQDNHSSPSTEVKSNGVTNKENIVETKPDSDLSLNLQTETQTTVALNAGETPKIVDLDKAEALDISVKQEEPILNELVNVREERDRAEYSELPGELDHSSQHGIDKTETSGAGYSTVIKEPVRVGFTEKRKLEEEEQEVSSNDLPPLKQMRAAEPGQDNSNGTSNNAPVD